MDSRARELGGESLTRDCSPRAPRPARPFPARRHAAPRAGAPAGGARGRDRGGRGRPRRAARPSRRGAARGRDGPRGPLCRCPYARARAAALAGPIFCTNTSYFVTLRHWHAEHLRRRRLLVIDEAHNLESQLVHAFTVAFPPDDMRAWFGAPLARLASAEAYRDLMAEHLERLEPRLEALGRAPGRAPPPGGGGPPGGGSPPPRPSPARRSSWSRSRSPRWRASCCTTPPSSRCSPRRSSATRACSPSTSASTPSPRSSPRSRRSWPRTPARRG